MKAPRPPATLEFDPSRDVVSYADPLWRIFTARGPHAQVWDEARLFGPLRGMRFDPHPSPLGTHSRGVLYAAASISTAFAEVFQADRVIARDQNRAVASWIPTRPLELLDLAGSFPVRNGASFAMTVGPKRFTQEWAHAIDEQLGERIDGVSYRSAITGTSAFVLFTRAWSTPSFPPTAGFHRTLDDPLLRDLLATVATELNFGIR